MFLRTETPWPKTPDRRPCAKILAGAGSAYAPPRRAGHILGRPAARPGRSVRGVLGRDATAQATRAGRRLRPDRAQPAREDHPLGERTRVAGGCEPRAFSRRTRHVDRVW